MIVKGVMSIESIIEEIQKGWPAMPSGALALRIIDFMKRQDIQELRMLTIPTLLEVVERKQVDAEFLAALAILVNSTVHALDAKAFLWDENEEEIHINAKELAEARRTGGLEHPVTGNIISDFENKLIPYFQYSSRFEEARGNG